MKNQFRKIGIALLACLMVSCSGKKAEEYEAIKKDIVVLKQNWKITQDELGMSVENLKEGLKNFEETESDLTKILATRKKADVKKEMETKLEEVKAHLDSLRGEMKDLNLYIKDWNEHSKTLNKLIKDIQLKEVENEEARKLIADLRAYKAESDPRLKKIAKDVEAYAVKYQEYKQYIGKFKTKK